MLSLKEISEMGLFRTDYEDMILFTESFKVGSKGYVYNMDEKTVEQNWYIVLLEVMMKSIMMRMM